MNRKLLAVILGVAMMFTGACGAIQSLIGGGGSGTVGSLWPDVPALDGAAKADLQLPPAAMLFIQAAMQGKLDFVAYTTSKSPQEVQAFYTNERMQAAGWNGDTAGCSDTAAASTLNATFCIFGKKENGKDIGLVIFVTQDDKKKDTQIFYVRIDVTSTPQP